MNAGDTAESLGRAGLEWLLKQGRPHGDGLAWPAVPSAEAVTFSLYQGTTGVVLALVEGYQHFGDDRYLDAAVRGARAIAAEVAETPDSSLYGGCAGMALALRAVADRSGDKTCADGADRALKLVWDRFDGQRWGELFELLFGNAGIALGALACGDVDLAVLAVEPYLATAEKTPNGVQWQHRPGVESRLHHISHGALGIVYALAAVGRATGRADLIELALSGAAEVIARDEAGPDGFLVPHSHPQYRPELIEPISYGWCHGPAGDAQVFRLLREVTGDPAWSRLAERCWRTVLGSGLPKRLRPGFWDNNGRCCGTAGVLALACDRIAEGDDGREFADILVTDLEKNATVDDRGARWSNVEHRSTPSDLEPRIGWAMGDAGIVRELLRYARIRTGGDPDYAVALPDQSTVHKPG